jgi:hypothetical protein
MSSRYGKKRNLPGYDEFRTGLTYRDIWAMLADESDDPADWKRKSRGVILWHWHKIKMDLYERATAIMEAQNAVRHKLRFYISRIRRNLRWAKPSSKGLARSTGSKANGIQRSKKKQQTIYFGVLVAQTTSRESALAMLPEHVSPAAAIGNTELWLIPQVECPLCCQRMPGDMADAHLIREHLRP